MEGQRVLSPDASRALAKEAIGSLWTRPKPTLLYNVGTGEWVTLVGTKLVTGVGVQVKNAGEETHAGAAAADFEILARQCFQ